MLFDLTCSVLFFLPFAAAWQLRESTGHEGVHLILPPAFLFRNSCLYILRQFPTYKKSMCDPQHCVKVNYIGVLLPNIPNMFMQFCGRLSLYNQTKQSCRFQQMIKVLTIMVSQTFVLALQSGQFDQNSSFGLN